MGIGKGAGEVKERRGGRFGGALAKSAAGAGGADFGHFGAFRDEKRGRPRRVGQILGSEAIFSQKKPKKRGFLP